MKDQIKTCQITSFYYHNLWQTYLGMHIFLLVKFATSLLALLAGDNKIMFMIDTVKLMYTLVVGHHWCATVILYLSGLNMMEGILTENSRLKGSLQNLRRSQAKDCGRRPFIWILSSNILIRAFTIKHL